MRDKTITLTKTDLKRLYKPYGDALEKHIKSKGKENQAFKRLSSLFNQKSISTPNK